MKISTLALIAMIMLLQIVKSDGSTGIDTTDGSRSTRQQFPTQQTFAYCVRRCTTNYGDVVGGGGGGLLTTVQDLLQSVLSVLVGDRGLVTQLLRTLGLAGISSNDDNSGNITLLMQRLRDAGLAEVDIRRLLLAISARSQSLSTQQRWSSRSGAGSWTFGRGRSDAGYDSRTGTSGKDNSTRETTGVDGRGRHLSEGQDHLVELQGSPKRAGGSVVEWLNRIPSDRPEDNDLNASGRVLAGGRTAGELDRLAWQRQLLQEAGRRGSDDAEQQRQRQRAGTGNIGSEGYQDFSGNFSQPDSKREQLYDKEASRQVQQSSNWEKQLNRKLRLEDNSSDELEWKSASASQEAASRDALREKAAAAIAALASRDRSDGRNDRREGTRLAAGASAFDSTRKAVSKQSRDQQEKTRRKGQQRLLNYEDQSSEKKSNFSRENIDFGSIVLN